MNNEQLVEIITKEVINRLKTMLMDKNMAAKKRVLVLEPKETLCSELALSLEKNNYVIDCIDNMGDLSSYEGIILQNIKNGELANLAHGIESSIKEKVAIQAIFNGKKLYLMEKGIEYKKFEGTSNRLFFNMFKEYEDKLVSYGIEIVGLKELIESLNNKPICLEAPTCKTSVKNNIEIAEVKENKETCIDLTNKKLVSEVELRTIFNQGIKEVLVSKKSIITPLAMDFARVNRLKINKG